jgi:hypothetical protein
MLILHGEGGYLDELVIVVIGFAVLWVAVRLSGRRSADADEETEEDTPEALAVGHPQSHDEPPSA